LCSSAAQNTTKIATDHKNSEKLGGCAHILFDFRRLI
jgi:hypothetical protein